MVLYSSREDDSAKCPEQSGAHGQHSRDASFPGGGIATTDLSAISLTREASGWLGLRRVGSKHCQHRGASEGAGGALFSTFRLQAAPSGTR